LNDLPRLDDVLILVPQIAATSARVVVLATWSGQPPAFCGQVQIGGQARGPHCQYADTLSTRTALRFDDKSPQAAAVAPRTLLRASAHLLEPCFWEPAHPFYYDLNLQLRDQEKCWDERQLHVGIRHLQIRNGRLELNGSATFLVGIRHVPCVQAEELKEWHRAGCAAWLSDASGGLCNQTDVWGPMILHRLPPDPRQAIPQVERLRNHPSLLMWVLDSRTTVEDCSSLSQAIRARDPSRLIGQVGSPEQVARAADALDLLLPVISFPAAAPPGTSGKPIIAVRGQDLAQVASSPDEFTAAVERYRQSLSSWPELAGAIL
jgi:hypothetical protein